MYLGPIINRERIVLSHLVPKGFPLELAQPERALKIPTTSVMEILLGNVGALLSEGVEEEVTTLVEVEVEAIKVPMTKIYKISHPSDYYNVNQTKKN